MSRHSNEKFDYSGELKVKCGGRVVGTAEGAAVGGCRVTGLEDLEVTKKKFDPDFANWLSKCGKGS